MQSGSLNLFNVKVGNKLLRAEDFRQSEDTYESVFFTTSDGTLLISVKKIRTAIIYIYSDFFYPLTRPFFTAGVVSINFK